MELQLRQQILLHLNLIVGHLALGTRHSALWGEKLSLKFFCSEFNEIKSYKFFFLLLRIFKTKKKKPKITRTRCGSSVQVGEFSSRLIRPATVRDVWYVLEEDANAGVCGRVPKRRPRGEFASRFSFSWHDSQHNLNTETAKLGQPRAWVLSLWFCFLFLFLFLFILMSCEAVVTISPSVWNTFWLYFISK